MKTITISGVIGWDVLPQDVRAELKAAAGDDVEIIISSPGGLVSDGLELFNMIRNYSGHTTARLSGFAMSMGSYIPLAADRVVAEDNAVYMIHNVMGGVIGNHNDIIKYGETVRAMSKMLGSAYAKKTGMDAEQIAGLMDAESFFFGEEMVEAGFVDEIIETDNDIDKESAMTGALVAFKALETKLNNEPEAVQNDITKAAALAGKELRAKAPATPAANGEEAMNLDNLKADHPDLVAAIVAEAREEMITAEDLQEQITTARTEGATAETARINDVRDQSIPGHEELIEAMAFDGKSTGSDAALAIVAAEKKKALTAVADLDADANDPVPPSADEDGGRQLNRKEFNQLSDPDRRAFLTAGGKIAD